MLQVFFSLDRSKELRKEEHFEKLNDLCASDVIVVVTFVILLLYVRHELRSLVKGL